jgi:hypothetical protein
LNSSSLCFSLSSSSLTFRSFFSILLDKEAMIGAIWSWESRVWIWADSHCSCLRSFPYLIMKSISCYFVMVWSLELFTKIFMFLRVFTLGRHSHYSK